jgi:hypothetical protein
VGLGHFRPLVLCSNAVSPDRARKVVVPTRAAILAREMEQRVLAALQRVRRRGQRVPPRVAEGGAGALPAVVQLEGLDHHVFAAHA